MKLEIKFKSESGYEYETLRTEWDRNDDCDTSAMVLIDDEESDGDGYYEVNVYKDHDTGEIAQCGYVNRFASTEDEDPVEVIRDVEIRYEQHDFDEVLRVANETLQPFGKRIVVDYDGECYWSIGSTDMDGSNVDYYAEGDFEHEVARDINESLAHVLARVKNPELVKHEDAKKYTQKEMENAVMLAADLYKRMYDSQVDGGSLEVANVIIDEAMKMEAWLTEKYGEDDEEYLDRLEEYEAIVLKEYGLEEKPKKKTYKVTVNITMSNTIMVAADTEDQAETIAQNWMDDDPYYYAAENNGAHCEECFVVETSEV